MTHPIKKPLPSTQQVVNVTGVTLREAGESANLMRSDGIGMVAPSVGTGWEEG